MRLLCSILQMRCLNTPPVFYSRAVIPLQVLGGESSDSSWWPGILAGAWLQAVALGFCLHCTLSGLPSKVSSASKFLFDLRTAGIGFGGDSNPIRPVLTGLHLCSFSLQARVHSWGSRGHRFGGNTNLVQFTKVS